MPFEVAIQRLDRLDGALVMIRLRQAGQGDGLDQPMHPGSVIDIAGQQPALVQRPHHLTSPQRVGQGGGRQRLGQQLRMVEQQGQGELVGGQQGAQLQQLHRRRVDVAEAGSGRG